MEANLLINKKKFELKYIKVQPGNLVSDTLKPSYTKFQDGRYWWSKQTSYEVEACWISDNLFDGIPESRIKNSDKYQIVEGKLYLRPYLSLVFSDKDILVERFDTDKELEERVLYLRGYVFIQPEVALTQINTESFKNYPQWYR